MENIIELKKVSKSYFETNLLKAISFSIIKGRIAGLIGETGSGKSTIAKIIVGLEESDGGEVLFKNIPLSKLKNRGFNDCASIQYIFQDPYSAVNPGYKVEAVLMEAIRLCKRNGRTDIMTAEQALEAVGLQDYEFWKNKKVETLSGGQKQRLCIARAIIPRPELIIADESTAMLDSDACREILYILKQLSKDMGLSLMIITHQLEVASFVCDDILVLHNGIIIEADTAEQVINSPKSLYTLELVESMKFFNIKEGEL